LPVLPAACRRGDAVAVVVAGRDTENPKVSLEFAVEMMRDGWR
jgi:hypothetical protein